MLLSDLKIADESIPQEPQAIEPPVSAYLSLKNYSPGKSSLLLR